MDAILFKKSLLTERIKDNRFSVDLVTGGRANQYEIRKPGVTKLEVTQLYQLLGPASDVTATARNLEA
jgi:hypothetical protein